jgi:hypothetical protein
LVDCFLELLPKVRRRSQVSHRSDSRPDCHIGIPHSNLHLRLPVHAEKGSERIVSTVKEEMDVCINQPG